MILFLILIYIALSHLVCMRTTIETEASATHHTHVTPFPFHLRYHRPTTPSLSLHCHHKQHSHAHAHPCNGMPRTYQTNLFVTPFPVHLRSLPTTFPPVFLAAWLAELMHVSSFNLSSCIPSKPLLYMQTLLCCLQPGLPSWCTCVRSGCRSLMRQPTHSSCTRWASWATGRRAPGWRSFGTAARRCSTTSRCRWVGFGGVASVDIVWQVGHGPCWQLAVSVRG